jgi:hypothetical protein
MRGKPNVEERPRRTVLSLRGKLVRKKDVKIGEEKWQLIDLESADSEELSYV